jgi:hypothetical protein
MLHFLCTKVTVIQTAFTCLSFTRFAICPTCVEIQEEWHRAKTDGSKKLWHQAKEQHYNDVGAECNPSVIKFWSHDNYMYPIFRSGLIELLIIFAAKDVRTSMMACG